MAGQVPAGWVQWLPFIPGRADKPFVLPPHMIYSTGANTQSTGRGLLWSGNAGALRGNAPKEQAHEASGSSLLCCAGMGSLHAPLPGSTLALLLRFYTENMFGSNSNKKIQRNPLLKVCTAPSFPKKAQLEQVGDCLQGLWQSRGLSHIWHLGRALPLLQETGAVSPISLMLECWMHMCAWTRLRLSGEQHLPLLCWNPEGASPVITFPKGS